MRVNAHPKGCGCCVGGARAEPEVVWERDWGEVDLSGEEEFPWGLVKGMQTPKINQKPLG